MTFDKQEMTRRFWELKKAIEATEAKVADLRGKYEPQWNAAQELRRKHTAEIKAVESKVLKGVTMFEAKNEMAFLARGLGNVGTDPAQPGA